MAHEIKLPEIAPLEPMFESVSTLHPGAETLQDTTLGGATLLIDLADTRKRTCRIRGTAWDPDGFSDTWGVPQGSGPVCLNGLLKFPDLQIPDLQITAKELSREPTLVPYFQDKFNELRDRPDIDSWSFRTRFPDGRIVGLFIVRRAVQPSAIQWAAECAWKEFSPPDGCCSNIAKGQVTFTGFKPDGVVCKLPDHKRHKPTRHCIVM